MDDKDYGPAALTSALDRYARWLDFNFVSGNGLPEREESGASLLHAVAEIRRHHCPGATQLMTNLLLDHTRLSTLLFEHQLKVVRGEASKPLAASQDCASLLKRQSATIVAMRSACTTQRQFCIHTAPPKFAGKQIAAKPASGLAGRKQLQG